jgi:hypothetical protein
LAIELQLDGILSISHGSKIKEGNSLEESSWNLQFKLLDELDGMNTKHDGQPNNMQLQTVMLNLCEAGILKRVTPKACPL